MRLVTIDDGARGRAGAVLSTGQILDFGRAALPATNGAAVPGTVREILEAGTSIWPRLRELIADAEASIAASEGTDNSSILNPDAALMAPVPDPQLVLATGLSYRSHLAEMQGTPAPANPTGFLKAPSSISGPGGVLRLPPQASEHVDYEGEFACVIGTACHNIGVEEALDHVAGYTVANDLSARDWAAAVWAATSPWEARATWEVNLMGKQLPGFTALGPVLTTIDEMPNLATTRLTTRVNGNLMQDAFLEEMLFTVAEVIAYFSRWYSFRPGDVILTGTPAGVGIGRNPKMFLKSGDQVDVTIDGIGTLTTSFA